MNFNAHSNLQGLHAALGASKYTWLKDDKEQAIERWQRSYIPQMGTILHEYAADRILYREKLTKQSKGDVSVYLQKNHIPRSVYDIDAIMNNLIPYVNDGIGFRMAPERVLYYSDNCFGTADTIQYYEKKKLLRIHDLKTGITPAHMDQLEIYAALFFLEYGQKLDVNPGETDMELRIYQSGEVLIFEPTAEDIVPIMDKIITHDKWIQQQILEG